MKFDLKRAFTNNIGLKLLSIVFAAVLWLLVVNIDDPSQTRSVTAVVNVINEEVLANQGKYYTIAGDNNTVTFRVTAKRSIIEKLTSADFTVTADMNYLENDLRIPVEVHCNRSGVTLSSKLLYLYVNVAEQQSSRFIVSGHVIGEPVDGFAVKDITVSPNVITVTGPAERINEIASVEAYADITDLSSDITESVVPTFYNSEGEAVDMTGLDISSETVSVSVDVVMLKTVDISVKPGGTLPEGIELESISVEPHSVAIMGEPEDINGVVAIVIPDTVINLTDVAYNFTTTVDIAAYLPEGVSLVDGSASIVTVNVQLVGESTADFTLATGMLDVMNLADGLKAKISENSVSVTLTSSDAKIKAIANSELTGYIDLNNMTAGTYQVPVRLNLEEGYSYPNTTVTVVISGEVKKPENTEDDTKPSEDGSSTDDKTQSGDTKPSDDKTQSGGNDQAGGSANSGAGKTD